MEKKPRSRKLNFQDKLLLFKKKNRRQTDPQVILVLLGLILVSLIAQVIATFSRDVQAAVPDDSTKFTATFVGDMMFGRNVATLVEHKGYDYMFRYVKPILMSSDYVTGNFENPIILRDESEYELPEKSIYLHANADVASFLSSINFTTVNGANNHMMDYGVAGLTETIDTFANTQTALIGAGYNKTQSNAIHYKDYDGYVVATLGGTDVGYAWGYATDHQGGANRIRLADMLPIIREASKKADLVLVNAHWGIEYDSSPTPRQREIAHAMVKAGADIVIGTHSHTLQPVELYNNGVILYSLGNFIFDQGWTKTKDSVLAQFKITSEDKKVLELMPMRINEATPTPLQGPLAGIEFNRMSKLLTKDLDKTKWKEENGKIIIELGQQEN